MGYKFPGQLVRFEEKIMKIVRFRRGGQSRYGVLSNDSIRSLTANPFEVFASGRKYDVEGKSYLLSEVKLEAPVIPSKIICLGLNYRPHVAESHAELPKNPLIFLKPPSAVIGPGEAIVLPRSWKRVDYEAELAVIIGKKAKYVSEKESREYILGYTCFNDVSERVYQKEDGQWTRAKGFDTFAPIGPWIETEIKADDLKVETYLNGEARQSDSTKSLIFGIPTLISFISNVMTLQAGDVIATGTPAGVGPLKVGDAVEIRIEGIGSLKNSVAAPD
jgi:2-keto-4-pentenoate hydratase/2-oxohepta-3-ene-1,7-dioic acid hydratase in catechol pathway